MCKEPGEIEMNRNNEKRDRELSLSSKDFPFTHELLNV